LDGEVQNGLNKVHPFDFNRYPICLEQTAPLSITKPASYDYLCLACIFPIDLNAGKFSVILYNIKKRKQ
jgi:hypothetical protein